MTNQRTQAIIRQFSRRIIALNPIFIDISGSTNAGILLSQILYWDNIKRDQGQDKFYKTDEEFCSETRLTLHELRTSKKKLTDLGLVSIVRRGIPAKSYYQVDHDTLELSITSYAESVQLVVENSYNLSSEIRTTNIDKITTEITTDNIYNAGAKALTKSRKKIKVSLEELSNDHIREWLSEKRMSGLYIHHDENIILEKFKNYCLSKGKKYENYVAAYRNAFEWDSNKPSGTNGNKANGSYAQAIRTGCNISARANGRLADLLPRPR